MHTRSTMHPTHKIQQIEAHASYSTHQSNQRNQKPFILAIKHWNSIQLPITSLRVTAHWRNFKRRSKTHSTVPSTLLRRAAEKASDRPRLPSLAEAVHQPHRLPIEVVLAFNREQRVNPPAHLPNLHRLCRHDQPHHQHRRHHRRHHRSGHLTGEIWVSIMNESPKFIDYVNIDF